MGTPDVPWEDDGREVDAPSTPEIKMKFFRLSESDRWVAEVNWPDGVRDFHAMPEGYDPNSDKGREAVLELMNTYSDTHI